MSGASEVLAVLTAVRLASATLSSVLGVARNIKEFNDLYERTNGNITEADIAELEAKLTVEMAETDALYAGKQPG
ncbi:hypothetical protein [Allohahella sp. A8]|uniref:hypothetical protein n=1 Tax=Allohahella sp. A8 TaxID=3141461 RepID=UPI003A80030E